MINGGRTLQGGSQIGKAHLLRSSGFDVMIVAE
jgi:hypothetical protein